MSTLHHQALHFDDGIVLFALSDKGLAAVMIGDDAGALLTQLQKAHPQKSLAPLKKHPLQVATVALLRQLWLGQAPNTSVPVDVQGSVFQQSVWEALRQIPHGQTRSYKAVAASIGNPKAYRAVANACGSNPVSLVTPCHRVTASDGLGGYHWGTQFKLGLLERERLHLSA